jgi:hypothetical protein
MENLLDNSASNSKTLSELKLEDLDFEWIKNEKSIKKLKKAIKLIEMDGKPKIIINIYLITSKNYPQ